MNNKALSNIVIVSLLIVVTISAIVVVWYFVSPIFSNLGKGLSPLNASENSSQSNGELNGSSSGCELIKAYWNNESVLEEDSVNLIVEGENCYGKTASFEIREDDGYLGYGNVNITPSSIVFNGRVLTTTWNAEWQKDWFGDPEYYFIVTVGDKNIKSGLLGVGKLTKFSPLETCKTIVNNGDGRINIVIFADNETAKKYAFDFLSFKPMLANSQAFNFFYIDSYQPDCEIYKGIAMLCRSKDMIKKASSCPNDYIMVIKTDLDSNIRSSAFLNIMSINSALPISVVQHEFGHVFAGLGEEYAPAILPKSAKNCVDNCTKFDISNGCYKECSNSDYYRSIDNGVMRTLSSSDYGLFNNKLILERLEESTKNTQINENSAPMTGRVVDLLSLNCSLQEYYLLEGVSNGIDNITFSPNASIEQGCASNNGYGEVQYNITENGTSMIKGSFNPTYIFSDGIKDDNVNESIDGFTFINDEKFYLKSPKNTNKSNNQTNITIKTKTTGGGCSGGCSDKIGLDDWGLPV